MDALSTWVAAQDRRVPFNQQVLYRDFARLHQLHADAAAILPHRLGHAIGAGNAGQHTEQLSGERPHPCGHRGHRLCCAGHRRSRVGGHRHRERRNNHLRRGCVQRQLSSDGHRLGLQHHSPHFQPQLHCCSGRHHGHHHRCDRGGRDQRFCRQHHRDDHHDHRNRHDGRLQRAGRIDRQQVDVRLRVRLVHY